MRIQFSISTQVRNLFHLFQQVNASACAVGCVLQRNQCSPGEPVKIQVNILFNLFCASFDDAAVSTSKPFISRMARSVRRIANSSSTNKMRRFMGNSRPTALACNEGFGCELAEPELLLGNQ